MSSVGCSISSGSHVGTCDAGQPHAAISSFKQLIRMMTKGGLSEHPSWLAFAINNPRCCERSSPWYPVEFDSFAAFGIEGDLPGHTGRQGPVLGTSPSVRSSCAIANRELSICICRRTAPTGSVRTSRTTQPPTRVGATLFCHSLLDALEHKYSCSTPLPRRGLFVEELTHATLFSFCSAPGQLLSKCICQRSTQDTI
jgi:hypothetical protein